MNTVISIPSLKGFLKTSESLRRVAESALLCLNQKNKTLDLYLVTDAEMARLNWVYRKKKGPTDVLSFESHSFLRGDVSNYLGELYLAPRAAVRKRKSLSLLTIHGVLHLLGYTHGRVRDTIEMEKKEDEILAYVEHHYRT